jgi:hypothetical protein
MHSGRTINTNVRRVQEHTRKSVGGHGRKSPLDDANKPESGQPMKFTTTDTKKPGLIMHSTSSNTEGSDRRQHSHKAVYWKPMNFMKDTKPFIIMHSTSSNTKGSARRQHDHKAVTWKPMKFIKDTKKSFVIMHSTTSDTKGRYMPESWQPMNFVTDTKKSFITHSTASKANGSTRRQQDLIRNRIESASSNSKGNALRKHEQSSQRSVSERTRLVGVPGWENPFYAFKQDLWMQKILKKVTPYKKPAPCRKADPVWESVEPSPDRLRPPTVCPKGSLGMENRNFLMDLVSEPYDPFFGFKGDFGRLRKAKRASKLAEIHEAQEKLDKELSEKQELKSTITGHHEETTGRGHQSLAPPAIAVTDQTAALNDTTLVHGESVGDTGANSSLRCNANRLHELLAEQQGITIPVCTLILLMDEDFPCTNGSASCRFHIPVSYPGDNIVLTGKKEVLMYCFAMIDSRGTWAFDLQGEASAFSAVVAATDIEVGLDVLLASTKPDVDNLRLHMDCLDNQSDHIYFNSQRYRNRGSKIETQRVHALPYHRASESQQALNQIDQAYISRYFYLKRAQKAGRQAYTRYRINFHGRRKL